MARRSRGLARRRMAHGFTRPTPTVELLVASHAEQPTTINAASVTGGRPIVSGFTRSANSRDGLDSAAPDPPVMFLDRFDQLRLVHHRPTADVEPTRDVEQMTLAGVGVDALGRRDRVV